ncbi:MAG: YgiQ family radical SAM protein [Clostridia bacterium]|nr:YgiQ family radical SAM protein [Clostridia bacterium]
MIVKDFLPVSRQDMEKLGWDRLDFILVTGDAYVDHPSFGGAVISRVLVDAGYRVGIIAQPNWRTVDDFKKLGRPTYGFLVTAGNIDSMVNHYSVNKKRRKTDNFSPGGEMGLRPDRATIVYTNMLRQAFKKVPIILGGIEASLRRFAHYDYWDDKIRRSILVDSEANMLIYGMGEKQVLEIADYMKAGIDINDITHIPGTCYTTDNLESVYDAIEIASFEEITNSKKAYNEAFKIQYEEQDPIRGKRLVQQHKKTYLVQNPPVMPLNREELDWVHGLHYMRDYHPMYEKKGGVPAIQEVKFSIISERGCFGSCSFCALTFHQGRIVQSRSHESILEEAKLITAEKDFKGYIHDVGGPTANFRAPACDNQLKRGSCKNKQCLFPEPCSQLKVDHQDLLKLLRELRAVPKVKKVFVRSGLRYDYIMADRNKQFMKELCEHHVSGQLKVAPEHISEEVLEQMGKPCGKTYDEFVKLFKRTNKEIGKEQYIVPYLMSSHPGSTLKSAIKLAEYLRDINYTPEQVQDFYPTPGTLSTAMFYTGLNPITGEAVYVPKSWEEKQMQRALLQYKNPKNYDLVVKALKLAHREDLIGDGPKCLVRDKTKYRDNANRRDNTRGEQGKHSNRRRPKR